LRRRWRFSRRSALRSRRSADAFSAASLAPFDSPPGAPSEDPPSPSGSAVATAPDDVLEADGHATHSLAKREQGALALPVFTVLPVDHCLGAYSLAAWKRQSANR